MGDFWKNESLSFWQNLIIEDKKLKFDYMIYEYPLVTSVKKIQKDGSNPNLGLGFGWISGAIEKIELT